MDEKNNIQLNENVSQVADTPVNCGAGACGGCCSGGDIGRCNLTSTNWLDDIPDNDFDIVEVLFKNTRRGFYRNSTHIPLNQGDWVAVEANPGHDIGRVGLTGRLVKNQMKRVNLRKDTEFLRVFRKAKPADMERYEQAKAREEDTMIRSRKIAVDLGLKMKIGDVEYQGDGNKAIFYYIADERVDFRQLIKVLADVFKIRVEMKQIGARQEAGRIGGIGPCGRPLCCATWMSSFVSVATSAARFQDISLNPQNLAGQCAKLKCCINFEVNTYVEAIRQLPAKDVHLETKDATYYYFKADALKREITYSTERNAPVNTVTLTAAQAFEIIALNKNGVKPDSLLSDEDSKKSGSPFGDLLNQDAINRFDKKKKKKKKKSSGDKQNSGAANAANDKPEKPVANGKPEKPVANGKQEKGEKNHDGGDNAKDKQERKQRQPKPKRPQQDAGQNGNERQPRADKPLRHERQPRPVKTFRPRQPRDDNSPQNGNGQTRPDSQAGE
jgi:cell fate regulator YaaT (PSP1 superfamily)